jgi:hypothetical protein
MGLELQAAGAAPGATEVIRTTGVELTVDGQPSILRHFDISPATNAGLDATVLFHYDDSELNGLTESMLNLFSSLDAGASWTVLAGAPDTGANTVSSSSLNEIGKLTLSTLGPVPTRLASFHLEILEAGIAVSWSLSEASDRQVFSVSRQTGDAGPFEVLEAEVSTTGRMSFQAVDNTVEPGVQYRYRVDVRDETGMRFLFESALVTAPGLTPVMLRNAPNPFSPSTTITYRLPADGPVTIDIYNLTGRRVRRLVEGPQTAGMHDVDWRGLDDSGRRVAPGIYFLRLVSDQAVRTAKLSLMQ